MAIQRRKENRNSKKTAVEIVASWTGLSQPAPLGTLKRLSETRVIPAPSHESRYSRTARKSPNH